LPGTALSQRLFPYASLTDLSFLKVEGFIAGVTNPLFETKREWWDVLAVLEPCDCEGAPMPHGSGLVSGALATVTIRAVAPAASEGAAVGGRTSALTPAPTAPPAAPAAVVAASGSRKPGGVAGTASAAAAHLLKPSRVTTSSPALFAVASTAGGEGARSSSSTAPPHATVTYSRAPYLDVDDLFYERVDSGRKFGEHWVRNAFEQHTASLLYLCTLQEEVASRKLAAGKDAAVRGAETPTLWSPTALAPSPTTASSVAAHVSALPPLHTLKTGPTAQQAKLLQQNADRIAAVRATAVYVAWVAQRANEEEWLCTASSVPEPVSPLALPASVTGMVAGGDAGANACDVAELKALARVLRGANGRWLGRSWDGAIEDGEGDASDASCEAVQPWAVPDPLPEGMFTTLTALGVPMAQGPPIPAKPGRVELATGSDSFAHVDPLALPPSHPLLLFMRLAHHLRFPSAQLYWLSLFPDCSGGLHPIAAGLLHADERVRHLAAHILEGFAAHPWPPARKAVLGLNAALQLVRSQR